MTRQSKLGIAAGLSGLFVGLVIVVAVLLVKRIISFELALLLLIALLGLYFGFGVLFLVYRFIATLE
jgi:hypothetical protein